MSTTTRARLVNPRLGTYFGIFASLFVSLFLMSLILTQLGLEERWLRIALLAAPVGLYTVFAIASATFDAHEYFASGRRVPAVYNGLVMAFGASGGTMLVAGGGVMFLSGYDAWCLVTGVISGFVIMMMLIAPYFRKFGAYTVPTFLARRLESRLVRVVAAALFLVPMLLILIAELKMGVSVARQLVQDSEETVLLILAAAAGGGVVVGGIRATTWSGAAQAIAALIALLVTVGLAGVLITNLPVPQLSSGPVLRALDQSEAIVGVAIKPALPLAFELSGQGLSGLGGRMSEPFNGVGIAGFVLMSLTLAFGVAGAPWLAPRTAVTPSINYARKSLGWAVFFFGLAMVTISSAAVFLRQFVFTDLIDRGPNGLPGWFEAMRAAGHAEIAPSARALAFTDISFDRDAALFALPHALDVASTVGHILVAGMLGVILLAIGTTLQAFAAMVADDVVGGLRWAPAPHTTRMIVVRGAAVVVIAFAAFAADAVPGDPLALMISALTISAATAFPVLVLATWWQRLTKIGALSGLASGFVLSVGAILAFPSAWAPVANPLPALVAVFASAFAAVVISKFTPLPSRVAIERLRDMRIPGGETIYDREMRINRLKERQGNRAVG